MSTETLSSTQTSNEALNSSETLQAIKINTESQKSIARVQSAAIAALPLAFIGVAVGLIFISMIQAVARNQAVRDKVFMIGILGFALTEAVALFDLLVVFLILYS